MVQLTIAITTKLSINASTILSLFQSLNNKSLDVLNINVNIIAGKSNIDQARSILITRWYDSSADDDMFMFLDSDQTFTGVEQLLL